MDTLERIAWTAAWRKAWDAVRQMVSSDDPVVHLEARIALQLAAIGLNGLPMPDEQALNEVKLRARLDCEGDYKFLLGVG